MVWYWFITSCPVNWEMMIDQLVFAFCGLADCCEDSIIFNLDIGQHHNL
jgi:hypothetical protein